MLLWGPGLESASHSQPPACEKTKTTPFHSPKYIAVDYLKENHYRIRQHGCISFLTALTNIDIQFQ